MKGKIIQWNDDRGFGFISTENEKHRIFFHISSVKTKSRRPEVGDPVEFNLGKDSNGKLRATMVAIGGLAKSKPARRFPSRVEPPRKNAFDYLLILIVLSLGGYCGYSYLQTQDIERIWPYLIPVAVSLLLLGRSKKPAQDSFSCVKCKNVEKFGPRTLAAWRRGMTRLFCSNCHANWLEDQSRGGASYAANHSDRPRYYPKKNVSYTSGRSGCLGMLLVLALPPVTFGVAIYQFLA